MIKIKILSIILLWKLEVNIKVNWMKIMRDMVMEYMRLLKVENMKVFGRMVLKMVKEYFIIEMVIKCMKEYGNVGNLMVKEEYIINKEN